MKVRAAHIHGGGRAPRHEGDLKRSEMRQKYKILYIAGGAEYASFKEYKRLSPEIRSLWRGDRWRDCVAEDCKEEVEAIISTECDFKRQLWVEPDRPYPPEEHFVLALPEKIRAFICLTQYYTDLTDAHEVDSWWWSYGEFKGEHPSAFLKWEIAARSYAE